MDKDKDEAAVECDVCGNSHNTEECPELGLSSSKFTPQISRARLTVPHYLNPMEFPDGRTGIVALEAISNKTQLGPFEAKKTMHDIDRDDLFVLKILSKDGSFISLDASSEAHCNWMSLVQVASSEEEQNCMAYQLGINIYFNTTRDLLVEDELKVWYAPQYAKKLGKSLTPDGKTRSMLGETLNMETEELAEDESMELEQVQEETDETELHPDDVEGDYNCKYCSAQFTSQFLFAKHIRDHLFPVYNYSDGPPRRGRRPVPLKIKDKNYFSPSRGRGRRGRSGRGRGRPRKSGRHLGDRAATQRLGGGMLKQETFEGDEEGLEDSEAKTIDALSKDEMVNKTEVEKNSKDTNATGQDKDVAEKVAADITEQVATPVKRGRGRPKKVVAPPPNQDSEVTSVELGTPVPELEENKDSLNTPDLTETSSGRLRRSARYSRGLGRLSKFLKYPGESSSDEEKVPDGSDTDEDAKPRKRFGAAMVASLRKAALDDLTSPVKKKSMTENKIKSPPSGTPVKRELGTMKPKLQIQKPVTLVQKPTTEPAKDPTGSLKVQAVKSLPSASAGEKSTSPTASPKSYIVVTEGDKTTTYVIPSSFQRKEPVATTTEITESTIETSEPSSSTKQLSTNQITPTADQEDQPLSMESGQKVLEELTEAVPEPSVEDTKASSEMEQSEPVAEMKKNDMEHEDVEEGETADEDGKVEEEVVVGTREEIIPLQHERKNTIADLDGTDALTALVNAAISADKVPDPIAMVAADLYGERTLEDDDDGDEYKAPQKVFHDTADEGDDSGGGKVGQISRPRRKKRRRGDDPELEELESMTKAVEGPNGMEEYACGVCNKHFTQLKYLKLHLPAHTDRYRCSTCGKRFARNESLLKHTCDDTASLVEQCMDENGSEIFTCRECSRTFSQFNFAIRHASMHRARFTCDKCGRTFLRQELLEEHDCLAETLEEGEVSTERHECQICKQAFTNGKYLFRHMAMHTDIYKCEVCGKCYSRKDSLQRHISRCCPELAGEYSVHVCPNCKKTFGTQLGLQNHQLNCGKYQCGACRVAFFSTSDLEEHNCAGRVLNEKASVQFPCKECNKTFASIAYLVRHEASHHGAFKCHLCSRVFIRKEELSWHTPVCETRQKIQKEGSAPCEVCGVVFNELLAFKEHHMNHTHPNKCEKCGKRFIKIGTLHNHKCEGVQEGGFSTGTLLSCNLCQKTFKNERYLQRHLTLHGQPEFSCEFCGKLFTRKDYLNDHQCRLSDGTVVRMVRKKNRLFIRDNLACTECGKNFSSRSNMMKHMKVHGEKQAECHICHKKFHYENYLKLHIATVHEKAYQLQCNHCGKVLFSKTGLVAHVKQFHADTIKLYPCPKCGKTFRQKGNMKTHLISHTKERAYKCDICSKAFKYPDQLNRHRLEHTLSQKFSCELCDKQFVRTYELRNHMRNYHSGFVYVCGVCHECCAHRHTIIRHYKRKHPEVGNVFEEKPEFLDSLQKPVSAATHSRMMAEAEQDIKPNILRVSRALGGRELVQVSRTTGGQQEIILTTEDDSSQTYAAGEMILQQGAAGEILASGEQAIQHVVEGPEGEQTIFILKVVNQDENGAIQEMEITEDTKAHLAQLIQAHSGSQNPITHIQVGDQTLQIQRSEEEEEDVAMAEDPNVGVNLVQEIKLDPQQIVDLQASSQVESTSGPREDGMAQDHTIVSGVAGTGGIQEIDAALAGQPRLVSVVDGTNSGVMTSSGAVGSMGSVTTSAGKVIKVERVQMVEMEDGRLGRIFQMEGGQQMIEVSTSSSGLQNEVMEMSQGDGTTQVLQLDSQGQLLELDSSVEAEGDATEDVPAITTAGSDAVGSLTGLKVTKRRASNGEIVVEVEGHDGQLVELGQALIGVSEDGGQVEIVQNRIGSLEEGDLVQSMEEAGEKEQETTELEQGAAGEEEQGEVRKEQEIVDMEVEGS